MGDFVGHGSFSYPGGSSPVLPRGACPEGWPPRPDPCDSCPYPFRCAPGAGGILRDRMDYRGGLEAPSACGGWAAGCRQRLLAEGCRSRGGPLNEQRGKAFGPEALWPWGACGGLRPPQVSLGDSCLRGARLRLVAASGGQPSRVLN